MFSFFRKKEKVTEPAQDFDSLIIRRADDFRSFYEERFAGKLNLQFNSLYLLDTIVDEARKSTASPDRKQWLAVHAGAYIFRIASLRTANYQYHWYHPLDQPMMIAGLPEFRIALLAQEAVYQRLERNLSSAPLIQLYTNFEIALVQASAGDDKLFV
jgi:antibiotic biosynthesis monooxygenase (ABM) superfamily enzyme